MRMHRRSREGRKGSAFPESGRLNYAGSSPVTPTISTTLEDTMVNIDNWSTPARCFYLPYEDYCEIRDEEPNPEFIGMLVRVFEGEAHLVEDIVPDPIKTT